MPRQARPLYRHQVRQHHDKPTQSVILQYTGRGLDFHSYVYGYPDGTFWVANLIEVPLPERVERLASELGFDVNLLPDLPRLKAAVVEALASEALLNAPGLLGELSEPAVYWSPSDARDLERKHTIAAARVLEIEALLLGDLRLRATMMRSGAPTATRLPLPMAPVPVVVAPEAALEVVEEEDDDEIIVPASAVVQTVAAAVGKAREAELPQRLPGGARRKLGRMPAAVYVTVGDALEPRVDLCAAMADAQAHGRKGDETTVIDWDGEWPVVARRYGKDGRTVYKVESALKRAGVEAA